MIKIASGESRRGLNGYNLTPEEAKEIRRRNRRAGYQKLVNECERYHGIKTYVQSYKPRVKCKKKGGKS